VREVLREVDSITLLAMKKKTILLLSVIVLAVAGVVTLVVLSRCRGPRLDAAWVAAQAERYVALREDIAEPVRKSILAGKIIEGMTPDEAVAAGGPFKYVIEDGGRMMASVADIRLYFDYAENMPEHPRMPPDILWMQRENPIGVSISLDFWNESQFDTTEPVGFRAHFSTGRVSRLERFENDG